MIYSYEQYGPVALILEDGKAICTAIYHDGFWTTETFPLIAETRNVFYQVKPCQSARTLDEMIAEINQRAAQQ